MTKENKLEKNNNKQVKKLGTLCYTYHGSLGSGRLLWIDIKSDAYWLNAFLSQPSSTIFFNSTDIFVGKIKGRPLLETKTNKRDHPLDNKT